MKTVFALLAMLSVNVFSAPFANLDFESPNIRAVLASNATSAPVRVVEAIPKWTFRVGEQEQQFLLYNNTFLSSAGGSFSQSLSPDRGKYTFSMTAGPLPSNSSGPLFSSSLYQTGTVPVNARSLLFDAGIDYGPLDVSLGGSLSPVVELSRGADAFHAYGIDVTDWAGKEAELRFTIGPGISTAFGALIIDNIRFSPVALVPEPSTWALLGVGGAFLLIVGRRSKT